MKAQDIYKLAIEMGMKADPRGFDVVKKNLVKEKEKYNKLSKEQKEEYDTNRLENPYSDSRLLLDNGKEVKKILTGMDMSVSEMLLAQKLGADLVWAHHPLGIAFYKFNDVMQLQAETMALYGVPINIGESLVEKRMSEISRRFNSANAYRSVDTAKILGLSLMCTHTITDNLVYDFLKKEIERVKPETVGEIIKLLKEIPEYKEAIKQGAGPKIFAGNPGRQCGKIAITEITGGTSMQKDVYERMSHFGIGTIIGMHMGEEDKDEAVKHHINVVIAGHISSDSLGMNLLLDKIEQKGIEIIPTSGLIRVKRK